jgi:hypothetical protein
MFYKQIKGTAMGNVIAPSYANITMMRFETDFLKSLILKPSGWLRFFDDIFFIWKHGISELHKFMEKLNSFNNFFKFTLTYSESMITFLDVKVTVGDSLNLDNSKKIETDVFRKDTNSYAGGLDFNSFHPQHTIHSLPYSLAFRTFKLCSSRNDIERNLRFIRENFIQRHFPVDVIDSQINRCAEKLLMVSGDADPNGDSVGGNMKNSDNRVTPFLVIDFNMFSGAIKNIISKHFHVVDPEREIFNSPTISYRRADNLRDLLVNNGSNDTSVVASSTGVINSDEIGQKACMGSRCLLCKQLPSISNVSFPDIKFNWIIKANVNCNSRNCVYLAVCRRCNIRYVGESYDFRLRMNNHNSQQNTLPASAFYRHKNDTGHCFRDFDLVILRSNLKDKDDMRNWERFFMDRFRTLVPLGLNKLEEL